MSRVREKLSAIRAWASRQPRQMLVGGAVGLVVLGWIAYAPPLTRAGKLGQELRALRAEVEGMRAQVGRVRSGLVQDLPAARQRPDVLVALEGLARSHGVEVLEMAPAGLRGSRGGGAEVLPVELRVEGEYRALAEFLGSLRENPSLGAPTVRRVRVAREERLLPALLANLTLELAFREDAP